MNEIEEGEKTYYSDAYNYSDSECSDGNKDSEYAEYSDITPLPRPKQVKGFFEIDYPEEYKKLMGYFFALYAKKEYSERALKLCKMVISEFCCQYTAWAYMVEIYEHIGYCLETTKKELEEQIVDDTKIYQAWNTYMWLIEKENASFSPIPTLEKVFEYEPKNFHAWSLAIWYANKWNRHKEIYDLALKYISIDLYNNSAWNTRRVTGDVLGISPESEFDAAAEALRTLPRNESARNFAFGLCEKETSLIPKLNKLGEELLEKDKDNYNAYRILLFQASVNKNQKEIEKLCDELIRTDPIRVNYYTAVKNGELIYQ
jgi:protein farnesyltransferase/geranylgeranyltransferase type-1 subunit alpha